MCSPPLVIPKSRKLANSSPRLPKLKKYRKMCAANLKGSCCTYAARCVSHKMIIPLKGWLLLLWRVILLPSTSNLLPQVTRPYKLPQWIHAHIYLFSTGPSWIINFLACKNFTRTLTGEKDQGSQNFQNLCTAQSPTVQHYYLHSQRTLRFPVTKVEGFAIVFGPNWMRQKKPHADWIMSNLVIS